MNHNDFSNQTSTATRFKVEKLKKWEFHMIFECKTKHGISYTLYEAAQMKGDKVVQGQSWIFITIDDGIKSDIMRVANNQMVTSLLDAFDLDPSINVIARIMDGDPKVEQWAYEFSPAMKTDADGWKLQKSEKNQLEAVLNASAKATAKATAVKKSKRI